MSHPIKRKSWINTPNILFVSFILASICIIVLQLIFIPSLRSPVGLPSPLVPFTSKYERFSIEHPKSWSVSEFLNGNPHDSEIIGYISPIGRPDPQIRIWSKMIDNGTAEDTFQWGKARAAKCDNFSEISTELHKISNIDGIQYVYTCEKPVRVFPPKNGTVKCIDYYLIDRSSAYDISSCASLEHWDSVISTFDDIINSFHLLS